jgi:large subunit ribosomal protein L35
MPKVKSNKSAAKRFKVSGSGKVKRRHANKSHILTKKAPKRKRHLKGPEMCSPGDARRVKRMLRGG